MKQRHAGFKYNSVTSLAFEIGHNKEDGSDITQDQIIQALLTRLTPLIGDSELMEATVCELVDTQLTDESSTTVVIPPDFVVQPVSQHEHDENTATCGHCGLSWDDSMPTSFTPAPSGRCPFEYFHNHN